MVLCRILGKKLLHCLQCKTRLLFPKQCSRRYIKSNMWNHWFPNATVLSRDNCFIQFINSLACLYLQLSHRTSLHWSNVRCWFRSVISDWNIVNWQQLKMDPISLLLAFAQRSIKIQRDFGNLFALW